MTIKASEWEAKGKAAYMEIIYLQYLSSINGWNSITDTSINLFKEQSALYHQRAGNLTAGDCGQGLYISNTDIKSFTNGRPSTQRL